MDWNLKTASWDLTELDEGGIPNIETVDNNESRRFGLVNRSKGEFCVDLKLGQVGNSGTESSGAKGKDAAAGGGGVSKTAPSAASGSSKRARTIHNGTQTVSCLVDGCNSDLSNCRDYHRRHKVCELHSKTPVVTIGGHKQRFCQQCSRFHSLEEFDEGKRSCRKRLDGHNRRRRKPQPVPLPAPAGFLSSYQGSQLLPLLSSSHVYPSSAVVNPGWDGRMQQVQLVHNKQQQLFLGSSQTTSTSNKQGNKQEMTTYYQNPSLASASVCHTLLSATARPLSAEESPPCALSLLSSPVQTHAPMSLMQPLGLTLHDHSLEESVDTTVLVNNGSDHCHPSMYNLGSDGSQGNQPPPSLPFHWE